MAHPALGPACQEVFDSVLGDRPRQLDRLRDDVWVTADQLLDVRSAKVRNTETGLRNNLYVALAYTAVWLTGNGVVAIPKLMEDAATAEISRSRGWQLNADGETLADTGEQVTRELVGRLLGEEAERQCGEVNVERFQQYYCPAVALISDLCLDETFVDFLTLPAYEQVI